MYEYGASPEQMHYVPHVPPGTPDVDNTWQKAWRAIKVPELLAHISTVCTLEAGDTVLTGTPEGVGPMRPGQRVAMGITGLLDAEFHVVRRESPPSA